MNLKYLDFNNCFSILSKFAFLLPNLVEIRIGSDAPPQMRLTTARLLVDNSQVVSQIKDSVLGQIYLGFTFSLKIDGMYYVLHFKAFAFVTDRKRMLLINDRYTSVSSHFFAICISKKRKWKNLHFVS